MCVNNQLKLEESPGARWFKAQLLVSVLNSAAQGNVFQTKDTETLVTGTTCKGRGGGGGGKQLEFIGGEHSTTHCKLLILGNQ